MSEEVDQVVDQDDSEEIPSDSEGWFFHAVLGVIGMYVLVRIPALSISGRFSGLTLLAFIAGFAVLALATILFRARKLKDTEVELSLNDSLLLLAAGAAVMAVFGFLLGLAPVHLLFVKLRPGSMVSLAVFAIATMVLLAASVAWVYSLATRRWQLRTTLVWSVIVVALLGLAMAFPVGFSQCQASLVLNC